MNKYIFVVCAVPFNTAWFGKPSKHTKVTIAFDNRKDANKYAEKKSQRAFDYWYQVKKIKLEVAE